MHALPGISAPAAILDTLASRWVLANELILTDSRFLYEELAPLWSPGANLRRLGRGNRFVPEDEVEQQPTIEVREPGDR